MISDEEHEKRECLARWMLDHWKVRTERQASLAKLERIHGCDFADDIKRRILKEFHRRKYGTGQKDSG